MADTALIVPPVIAENPVLSAFWTYWHRKRAGRAAPRRLDIEPTEVPQLLPHIQLIDRVGDRFRYRLCGTAIVEAYGRELTGKFLDEVIPTHRRQIAEQHFELVYKAWGDGVHLQAHGSAASAPVIPSSGSAPCGRSSRRSERA